VPPERVRHLAMPTGFFEYMESPPPERPIIKMIFPDGLGTVLAPVSAIPSEILIAALQSIRGFLRERGKSYFQNKLNATLPGKETQVGELINTILMRSADCGRVIEAAHEFTYVFFLRLVALIKTELADVPLQDFEITVMQSVCIIEALNGYYRVYATREKEQEARFQEFEEAIDKPPYLHSMESLMKLTDRQNVPFAELFSHEEFDAFIKAKTALMANGFLPEMLTFRGPNGEGWFICKNRVFPYCSRLLTEAQSTIKESLAKRWYALLERYDYENAMDHDEYFADLIVQLIQKQYPILHTILTDQKLSLLYGEIKLGLETASDYTRFFSKDKAIPLPKLFPFKRRDLLQEVRLKLPFWYSIPIFVSISRMFRKIASGGRE
jgi:hypothetical protein